MSAPELITYATIVGIGGAAVILFIGFMVSPKRTRRTVNYMLNTLYEFKQAKSGKDGEKIEVPNFETVQQQKVPDPREKKK